MHWVAAPLSASYSRLSRGRRPRLWRGAAFSGNVQDKDLEAAMTAAFATGPLGAALGVVLALWVARRR